MTKIKITQCKVDGCIKARNGRDTYCGQHRYRWNKYQSLDQPTPQQIYGYTEEERFWSQVAITMDETRCWEWQGVCNQFGYGRFSRYHRFVAAHRFAWFLTYKKMPTKYILHSCDNRKCVNPSHLSEGTHTDNMKQMSERQRSARGQKNAHAKLTDDAVKQIRILRACGVFQKDIATIFGVSRGTVQKVEHEQTWKHVA